MICNHFKYLTEGSNFFLCKVASERNKVLRRYTFRSLTQVRVSKCWLDLIFCILGVEIHNNMDRWLCATKRRSN